MTLINTRQNRELPVMTDAGLHSTRSVTALNENGEPVEGHIAEERTLTVYLDKQEIITLMTLGNHPELLILGWLHNQQIVTDIGQIKSVQVDWETASAAVVTHDPVKNIEQKLRHRTVTTGCGQGSVFGNLLTDLDKINLPATTISQSTVYRLLSRLAEHNETYRRAGAVHGCALCNPRGIDVFIEDVGRHNAVDAIAGYLWLEGFNRQDQIFYTTGRLTSEMVIKVSLMGISVLLSRSGITSMGLAIARKTGVTLIARARGKHFLIYHGHERVLLDERPVKSAQNR